MIVQARARRPLQREVAHLLAHFGVIGPHRRSDVLTGKSAAVAQHLRQRDVAFAVLRELRHVFGDAVIKSKQTVFHQCPDAHRGDHLGIGKQQPQRVVACRFFSFNRRLAKRFKQRELAMPRQRNLRAGIAALGHMSFNYPSKFSQRRLVKSELSETCPR